MSTNHTTPITTLDNPGSGKKQDRAIQEKKLSLDVQDVTEQEPVMSDIEISEPDDHFSDEISADAADTEKSETNKPPVPPLIKFGLPALVIIVLVITGVVTNYIISDDDAGPVQAVSPNSFKIGGAPIEPGAHAPATGAPVPFPVDEQLSGIESDIDTLRLIIAPLQKSNAELQTQVTTLYETVTERDRQLDELRSMLISLTDNTIPSLVIADKQHTKTLNALQGSIDKNKRRIDQATQRKAETPPFTLLSIDEWGAMTSAVLEMNGKTTVASVGDVRAGWRITKIVRPDCVHAVRVTGRKTVKICGTGGL